MPKFDVLPLYQVPALYEALLGGPGDDLDWYREQTAQASAVLDLGTGTGRVALAMASPGRAVWGLDNSEAMLAHARSRTGDQDVTWVLGDLREFELGRGFDRVLIPYNGLQHLVSVEELLACLRSVKAHLEPDGRVALDLHLPQPSILARDPDEWFGVEQAPSHGWQVLAEQSRWDPATQVLLQRWSVADGQGGQRLLELPLRQIFPAELKTLFKLAGLEILEHWGGFDRRPLATGALKQVVVARTVKK